jgi:hypothetical protein
MRLGRVALMPVAIVVMAVGAALLFPLDVDVSRWKRPPHSRCSERFGSEDICASRSSRNSAYR